MHSISTTKSRIGKSHQKYLKETAIGGRTEMLEGRRLPILKKVKKGCEGRKVNVFEISKHTLPLRGKTFVCWNFYHQGLFLRCI